MEIIISERNISPFANLYDFIRRVRLSKSDCENLIKCGAFSFTAKSSPSLMWELEIVYSPAINASVDNIFNTIQPPVVSQIPTLPDYALDKKIEDEMEILEMSPSLHPLGCVIRPCNAIDSSMMIDNINKPARMIGYLSDRKRIKTKNDKIMQFLTLEDEYDTFEAVLFPDIYLKFGDTAFSYKILDINGKIEKTGGNIALVAETVKPYVYPGGKVKRRKRA